MEIYAAIGVPEVWRCDGRALTIAVLTDEGYAESDYSPTFPNVPLAGVHRRLRRTVALGVVKIWPFGSDPGSRLQVNFIAQKRKPGAVLLQVA